MGGRPPGSRARLSRYTHDNFAANFQDILVPQREQDYHRKLAANILNICREALMIRPLDIAGGDIKCLRDHDGECPMIPAPFEATAADEDSLGPAMRALNQRQRVFVLALVTCASNPTEAARLAGYSGNEGSLCNTATRLAHTPAVQDAIDEEARKSLYGAKLVAVRVLLDVMNNPAGKISDRLKAASMTLNRVGMPEVFNQNIVVEHVLSDKDKIREIAEMAKKLGLDPKQVLGSVGVVDAEFTEVPALPAPDGPMFPIPSLQDPPVPEGLEDVW